MAFHVPFLSTIFHGFLMRCLSRYGFQDRSWWKTAKQRYCFLLFISMSVGCAVCAISRLPTAKVMSLSNHRPSQCVRYIQVQALHPSRGNIPDIFPPRLQILVPGQGARNNQIDLSYPFTQTSRNTNRNIPRPLPKPSPIPKLLRKDRAIQLMINMRLRPVARDRTAHPAERKRGLRHRHRVEFESGPRVALQVCVVDPYRLAAF